MTEEPGRSFDQALLLAWQAELQTTPNPIIKEQYLPQEPDLLPRFVAHYGKLKALRRRVRRSLQRQWKRSLAGVALLLALGQAPALAATINVGGTCTLIRAIVAANHDTATPGCKTGIGADTIVLPRGSTQTLTTVNNTNYGPTGLPTVRTPITIAGNGSTIRRVKSAPKFHIFSVAKTGKLTLQKTVVSGGVKAGVRIISGGVLLDEGTLNLVHSTVSGNSGCAIGGTFDINFEGYSQFHGTANINNSTVSGNTFCGVEVEKALITNSTIAGNHGVGVSAAGQARIINSTIAGNGGSGVYAYRSSATIINSTITGNVGTVYPHTNGTPFVKHGGGVYIGDYSGVSIINSTISGNSAEVGAGIYGSRYFSSAGLTNSTITGNTATSQGGGISASYMLELKGTLISGNTAPKGPESFANSSQYVTAGRFNIFGHNGSSGVEGFSPGTTDIVPSQPLSAILNPRLANTGGPTQTHALVAGSPAIDAINDGTCPPPATDQRGVKRPQDGNGDGGLRVTLARLSLR